MQVPGPEQNVSGVELSWLVPVGLAILGAVVHSVIHGVRVRDLRFRNHGVQRRELHAAIEAEFIIPSLANFVCSVWDESDFATQWFQGGGAPDCIEQVGDRLQQVAFLDELDQLSQRYEDLLAVDNLYDRSIAWARRRAMLAPIVLILLVGPTYRVVVGLPGWMPDWLTWVLGVLAALLAGVSLYSWWSEARCLNRLAELSDRYV